MHTFKPAGEEDALLCDTNKVYPAKSNSFECSVERNVHVEDFNLFNSDVRFGLHWIRSFEVFIALLGLKMII